jgi:hypothetical protein
VELDDIGVVHLGVDLEFRLELLLHLLLWHMALHNLEGVFFLRTGELSIIADCEPSLTQAFADFVNGSIGAVRTYMMIQSAKPTACDSPRISKGIEIEDQLCLLGGSRTSSGGGGG